MIISRQRMPLVFRARREAGDTVSCHRFVGHFNVKASNDFDFESYNLSAKNDNEFKEEVKSTLKL